MLQNLPSEGRQSQDSIPLVSVIIPTYNVEPYIGQAIASVLEQTIQSFEIIVVDDGSTDDTVKIVCGIDDPRVRLFRNAQNQGVAQARNIAIRQSKGTWIAILDSDDWWAPNRLERLLAAAQRYDAAVICDDLQLVNDGERQPFATFLTSRVKVFGAITKATIVTPEAMIKNDFGYLKPIVRRDVFSGEALLYDRNARISEDFKWLVECLCVGHRLVLLPEPYYYYRRRSDSLSSPDNLEKEIRGIGDHIRLCEELMTRYGDRRPIKQALKLHIYAKKIDLVERVVKRNWGSQRYMKAIFVIAIKPGVLRPLLRNVKNRLFA
ncbi:glycosyltransferase family 2 protein [Cohnella sp. AR92]|uniref:glycosyltransferase family 2 protein n=1 Tax=Cohnella sp. AR92 TaxID=648716 RepID=UPI000F8F0270|nr:glycosyltransferase family 2 protein [Cohnella sp. AR92]RUS45267.1 glycosyltransferase family 2 protein [Cohnella sp. AR92]